MLDLQLNIPMKKHAIFSLKMLALSLFFILHLSCSKDSDLLLDSVLNDAQEEVFIGKYVQNDTFNIYLNDSVVLDVLSNDNFENPEEVVIMDISSPSNGSVVVNEDNTITYTPTSETTTAPETVDTFTYTVEVENTDNSNGTETGTVTVTNRDSTLDDFVACKAGSGATYNPTSSADIQSAENAGKTAVITNSFDCAGCTFASGQTIIPSGGVISGTGINVNGACIMDDFSQLFTSSVTFSSTYEKSRLSAEAFGANGSDSVADDAALIAVINNSEYIIGKENSIYIKNDETVFFSITGTGIRDLDWNMNNSIVRTTSANNLSHGDNDNSSKKYLFEIREARVKITNGEFDGQDLASRAFYLRGTESIDFQNVNVHNYYAPPNAKARGMAFLVEAEDNYTGGQWIGCTFANIGAASDGNFNNVPYGFSKGIYFTVATENVAETVIRNSTFKNIYGDDAEGFSNTHKYQYSYQHATSGLTFVIDNNDFIGCQRRALKVNLSNCQITNNLFESATNSGAGFQASLVQTFPIHNNQTMRNVNTTDNTFRILGDSDNAAFGINDATDCLIENNTFQASHASLNRFITFGVTSTQNGLYEGDLDNTVIFRNNTIDNIIVRLPGVYEAINGGFVFEDVTIDIDVDTNFNAWWGVFRIQSSSGDTDTYTFKDVTVNINQTNSAGGLFVGAFMSLGRNIKNVTLDNFDVNYTGGTLPSSPFGRAGTPGFDGNFDNTNTILNCDLTGASGAAAINVTGNDARVVIQNSYGDGNTSITTN